MASPQSPAPRMTFEGFVEWVRHQELKHEVVDGAPVAMAGGTEAYNVIQGTLFAAARAKLAGGPCRPFTSDMLVRTGTGKVR